MPPRLNQASCSRRRKEHAQADPQSSRPLEGPGPLMAAWEYLGSHDGVPGTSAVGAQKVPPTKGVCTPERPGMGTSPSSSVPRSHLSAIHAGLGAGCLAPGKGSRPRKGCQASVQKARQVTNPWRVQSPSTFEQPPMSSELRGERPALSFPEHLGASAPSPLPLHYIHRSPEFLILSSGASAPTHSGSDYALIISSGLPGRSDAN